MKKQYKILCSVIFIEVFIISILNETAVKIQSWFGNAIGALIFLFPIQILLFMLSKDEKFSKSKRMFFKIVFWFIIICYLLGGIATLLEKQSG